MFTIRQIVKYKLQFFYNRYLPICKIKIDRLPNRQYNSAMNLQEIKRVMEVQGWTIAALAKELSINPVNLGRILSGHRPLTEQLKKHIEYVLGERKSQMLIFTVDLPEASCRAMFPGWDSLTEEEKRESCQAVIRESLKELIALGAAALTEEELQKLKEIAGES